jgi:hypothetical protein
MNHSEPRFHFDPSRTSGRINSGRIDGGRNWESVGAGIATTDFPEALAVDDAGRLYAGCRSGDLYTSDDVGASWRRMDIDVPGDHQPGLRRLLMRTLRAQIITAVTTPPRGGAPS